MRRDFNATPPRQVCARLRPLLVSLEGIEGSGKSTCAELLVARLCGSGVPAVVLPDAPSSEDPLITSAFADSAFLSPGFRHGPQAALYYMLYNEAVLSAQGFDGLDVVIRDRGIHSVLLYQGIFTGDPDDPTPGTSAANAVLPILTHCQTPLPDQVLLFEGPVDQLLARAENRDGTRFSQSERAMIARIAGDYSHTVSLTGVQFSIIDATLPPTAMAEEAYNAVMKWFGHDQS